jgi:hypothetical protein
LPQGNAFARAGVISAGQQNAQQRRRKPKSQANQSSTSIKDTDSGCGVSCIMGVCPMMSSSEARQISMIRSASNAQYILGIFALLLAILVAPKVFANDTTAELATGGLIFTKSDGD